MTVTSFSDAKIAVAAYYLWLERLSGVVTGTQNAVGDWLLAEEILKGTGVDQ